MMIYELTNVEDYKVAHSTYKNERGSDTLQNVELAARLIMKIYINPGGDSDAERGASALRWYETRYGAAIE